MSVQRIQENPQQTKYIAITFGFMWMESWENFVQYFLCGFFREVPICNGLVFVEKKQLNAKISHANSIYNSKISTKRNIGKFQSLFDSRCTLPDDKFQIWF